MIKSTVAMGTKLHPSKAKVYYDPSDYNIAQATKELIQLLGPDNVISDLDERRAHSITKWSPAAPTQIPSLVVFPGSTADVSAVLRMCSSVRLHVVGFCGGTSMPGALAATRGGICIDFNRMDKIEEIHSQDMDVVVQPAVDWQDLNVHLEPYDLFFPPDPGPGAKIGGMVCLNSSSDIFVGSRFTESKDRHELFRHKCIPVRTDETMGRVDDSSPCGRYDR